MIILGVDPGTAITGYGIIKKERDKLTQLDFGCIKTPAGLDAAERLKILSAELKSVIKKHRPQSAAIEKIFFYDQRKDRNHRCPGQRSSA